MINIKKGATGVFVKFNGKMFCILPKNDCRYCQGMGQIPLLTSVVTCDCIEDEIKNVENGNI